MILPPASHDQMSALARNIRLLLLDVDGVLTDGTIAMTGAGEGAKPFFVRDGAAMVWARKAGIEIGLLSGRSSDATIARAAELKITIIVQGESDKGAAFDRIAAAQGLDAREIAYMGDDLPDLPVLMRAGLSGAPADACEEVRQRVHCVTRAPGGRGAVREFIELILRGRGHWDSVVRSHLA